MNKTGIGSVWEILYSSFEVKGTTAYLSFRLQGCKSSIGFIPFFTFQKSTTGLVFTMGKPIHSLLYMYYISSFLAPVIKTTLQGSGEVFGSVELCCRNQKNIVQ